MTIPLAHAGHWLVQLLYLAPILLIAVLVGWGKLQEKRGKRPGRDDGDDEEPSFDDALDRHDRRSPD